MTLDARLGYDVWLRLIADEELYRAMLANRHRELARQWQLGPDELAILDAFHGERGTRWNIENLRFRAALEARATLESYMPRTCRLLCRGDTDWLQDVVFEYLAFYRWTEHGHRRLTECERFGEYVRERITKRRITPPALADVLAFELGVIALLKKTATIEDWPSNPPVLPDDALATARVAASAASTVIEVERDIRSWVASGDPLTGEPGPGPVTFVVYVPSLRETHKIKIVGEGPKLVLERLARPGTVGEIAAELEAELGIDAQDLFAMIRGWIDDRLLVVTSPIDGR